MVIVPAWNLKSFYVAHEQKVVNHRCSKLIVCVLPPELR